MESERLHRIIGAIEIAIGAGAVLAPGKLVALYGVPAGELTGIGAFGMRLFGIRNLMTGVLATTGNQQARDYTLAVQAPDIAMFVHAFKTGYVPKQAAAGAIGTASLVTGLALAARR